MTQPQPLSQRALDTRALLDSHQLPQLWEGFKCSCGAETEWDAATQRWECPVFAADVQKLF